MTQRRLGVLALVVMLLADAVLLAWVFGLLPGSGADAAVPEPATQPTATSASPSASPSTTSKPAAPAARYVATSVGDTLWRASVARCTGDAAVVERSQDGGASWERTRYDGQVVYRLRLTEPSVGFAVGADRGCPETVVKSTGDGGQTWQETSAGQTWAPLRDGSVLVPGGEEVDACGSARAVGLAPVDETSAWAACSDGTLRRTTDTGASWEGVGRAKGVTSLAVSGERLLVGSVVTGCDGLSVASGTTSQADLEDATCVLGARTAAVVLGEQGGWLVGTSSWSSADLSSWEPVA